jgi:hypothetical protein
MHLRKWTSYFFLIIMMTHPLGLPWDSWWFIFSWLDMLNYLPNCNWPLIVPNIIEHVHSTSSFTYPQVDWTKVPPPYSLLVISPHMDELFGHVTGVPISLFVNCLIFFYIFSFFGNCTKHIIYTGSNNTFTITSDGIFCEPSDSTSHPWLEHHNWVTCSYNNSSCLHHLTCPSTHNCDP